MLLSNERNYCHQWSSITAVCTVKGKAHWICSGVKVVCTVAVAVLAAGRTGPAAPGSKQKLKRAAMKMFQGALTRSFERWAEHVEEEMEMKQKLKRAAMKMFQGALTRSFERQLISNNTIALL